MKTWKRAIRSAVVLAGAILGGTLPPAVAQQDRGFEVVPLAADAGSRWALVIGNAEYASGKLRNPLNDAVYMAAMLEELGFAVGVLENAGHQAMEDAIRAFGLRLRTGGVGVFYYAGHAVQVDGANYLVPVGAEIRAESEIRYKTVNLGFLLDHMGEARNRLNIVILDACRDNPFRGFRSLKRGLAETRAPTGTLIAYATAPGDVAADGTGRHGVFTEHLLEALRLPGLTIEEVMKSTRRAVIAATADQQVPWTASSLVGELILRSLPAASNDFDTVLPPMPGGSEFSLSDLHSRADAIEAAKKAWSEKLEEMKAAFEEARRLGERAIPGEFKVEGWQRFLAAFSEDNPFSTDDDAMRSDATEQLERWRRETDNGPKGPAPMTLPKPELKERWQEKAEDGPKGPAPMTLPKPELKERWQEKAEDGPKGPAPITPPKPELKERWQERAVGMWFRYLPQGTFRMGSPEREKDRDDDETFHQVKLTRGFWIGETEVTQDQWRQLAGNNPSRFKACGESCPVETVNWYESLWYANELSKRAGFAPCYELSECNRKNAGEDLECSTVTFTGVGCSGYRLPTEAEWEYAARAGTRAPFWTGENLTTDQANYDGNYPYSGHAKGKYRQRTVEVRSFDAPNPWGLHEVHGNVWEWVWDWYGSYSGEAVDPLGPPKGSYRVIRGGGWINRAHRCRAANRNWNVPGYRLGGGGFRLVRTYP